jgi:hypothetical protein
VSKFKKQEGISSKTKFKKNEQSPGVGYVSGTVAC